MISSLRNRMKEFDDINFTCQVIIYLSKVNFKPPLNGKL